MARALGEFGADPEYIGIREPEKDHDKSSQSQQDPRGRRRRVAGLIKIQEVVDQGIQQRGIVIRGGIQGSKFKGLTQSVIAGRQDFLNQYRKLSTTVVLANCSSIIN